MMIKIGKQALFLQYRTLTKKPKGIFGSTNSNNKSLKGPPYTHFVQIGDPVLKQKCQPVNKEDILKPEIQNIIHSMVYTLERYDGVGISAPQIGVPLQIIAVQFTKSQLSIWSEKSQQEKKMEVIPLQIFINPSISILDNSQVKHREGCCSLHGFSCLVPRSKTVKLTALNQNGEDVEVKAKDWTARILQHEMDHLHGTLITDKMDSGSLSLDYWSVINSKAGDFRLSFAGIKSGPKKWLSSALFWKSV